MSWYTNPWVIGVIGSIPGGLLVNWISGRLLSKKENREYLQKVIGANREVVYAIRPGISEGHIPSPEVLTALLNATARRYGVEQSDLYTSSQIAEELTKEIMDSSFISSAQKSQYCAQLAAPSLTAKKQSPDTTTAASTEISAAQYRQRVNSSVSTFLGLLTVMMTLMVSVLEVFRSRAFANSAILNLKTDKNLQVFIPFLATVGSMALTLVGLYLYRELAQTRRRQKQIDNAVWAFNRHVQTLKVRKGSNLK